MKIFTKHVEIPIVVGGPVYLNDTSGNAVDVNWVEVTNLTTSALGLYTVATSGLAGYWNPASGIWDTTDADSSGTCGMSNSTTTSTTTTLDLEPFRIRDLYIHHSLGSAAVFVINYGLKVTKPFNNLRNVGA
tara:strand:+ start:243 stop:638 length:396 start_codon:yes stop_codon:yes gene_type:complete